MSNKTRGSVQRLKSQQRDLWVLSTSVIVLLAVALAVVWPSLHEVVKERFGARFSSSVLLGEVLALIFLLVVYTARKGALIQKLVRQLVLERDAAEGVQSRLSQAQSVLEASTTMHLERGSGEALQRILEGMTQALRGDRGILYRMRLDGKSLERDVVFPSTTTAPSAEIIRFEDEVSRVARSAQRAFVIESTDDPKELGITAPRPEGCGAVAAAPLLLDNAPVGAVLIRNPAGSRGRRIDAAALELVEVFAGFAAIVIRNVRRFQEVSERNAELDRSHNLLSAYQQEMVDMQVMTTLARVVGGLTHSLSGPLTALEGYAQLLGQSSRGSKESHEARRGIRTEMEALSKRLQTLLDFTSTYRSQYQLVDLSVLVNNAAELLSHSLHEHNIELQRHFNPNLPLTMVDPLRMRQVFLGVLGFAVDCLKYSKSSRVVVVRLAPSSGYLRLQVSFSDEQGISDIVGPLLNPNTEFCATHHEYGLALSTATSIVRHHLGNIGVEYENEDELMLAIEIPIRRSSPARVGSSETEAAAAAAEILDGKSVEEAIQCVLEEEEATSQSGSGSRDTSGMPSEFDHVFPSESAFAALQQQAQAAQKARLTAPASAASPEKPSPTSPREVESARTAPKAPAPKAPAPKARASKASAPRAAAVKPGSGKAPAQRAAAKKAPAQAETEPHQAIEVRSNPFQEPAEAPGEAAIAASKIKPAAMGEGGMPLGTPLADPTEEAQEQPGESLPPDATQPPNPKGASPPSPDKPGIDQLFDSGGWWQDGDGAPPPPAAAPPANKKERRESAPLLDPNQVDDALKLFDEK